jgi:hypothetical protein
MTTDQQSVEGIDGEISSISRALVRTIQRVCKGTGIPKSDPTLINPLSSSSSVKMHLWDTMKRWEDLRHKATVPRDFTFQT